MDGKKMKIIIGKKKMKKDKKKIKKEGKMIVKIDVQENAMID